MFSVEWKCFVRVGRCAVAMVLLWECLYDRLTIIQVAQILQISVELVSFFATRGEKVINIEKGGNIEKKELYTKL